MLDTACLVSLYNTRSELALLPHSFTPCLTLQSESEGDATIISAFIATLHCACSYGTISLERVVYCISSFVTEPSGLAINQH